MVPDIDFDWSKARSASEWREIAKACMDETLLVGFPPQECIHYISERYPAECSKLVDMREWVNKFWNWRNNGRKE